MADIHIEPTGGEVYQVTVSEGGSTSRHKVTVPQADLERLGGGASAERLLEASFEFLLEREPKESILPSFEISVIGKYFPEYSREIGKRI